MRISATLFFILLFPFSFCYGQMTTEKKVALFNTFKFIQEQQSTIVNIRNNFPKLSIEANIAAQEFNKKYSQTLSKINLEVRKEIGSNFKQFITKIINENTQNFNSEKMSEKEAYSYIKKVKNHAKGNIPSQYIETFKTYEGIQKTKADFLANYNVHEVKSYTSSRILELKVKIPKNWKEIDGMHPSVLKKFRSENGTGNKTITIDRIDNPYISTVITEKQLFQFVPENSKVLSSQIKIIDNNPIGILEYEQENSKNGSNQKRIILEYIVPQFNDILLIYCANYGTKDEDLKPKLEKSKILFQSIFESIRFNNTKENNIITYKN